MRLGKPALNRIAAVCFGASMALSSAASWAQDVTTLKLNLVISATDPVFAYWKDFAKQIEDESQGTLKIEVYPTETLGKTTDMIEAASFGAPILQDSDPSHLSNYVPDYSVFMAPYLFKKPADIPTVWESEIGQRMEADLHKKGLRILTLVYFGTRNLMCNEPVLKREDTKNLKVRNAQTKMWNWVGDVLGGIRVNTAWSEVYTALSQGVADCVESPMNVVYAMKFHELLKQYNLTEHLVAPTSIVMSEKVYESLPEAAQNALDKVGHSYPAVREAQIKAIEQEYRGKLEEAGVTINENVDKSAFIDFASGVSAQFPEWTPNLYQDISKVIEE